MELLLREVRKKQVAEEWKSVFYRLDGTWTEVIHNEQKPTQHVYEELLALGKDPDADRIDEIIGNTSWTRALCHNCAEYVDDVVVIGEMYLCEDCINLAKRMIAIGEPS